MELSDKTVREICSCAQFRNLRRGEAIFCEEAMGKDAPHSIELTNLKKGEVCIATDFYSTGHIGYNFLVNIEDMQKCPYRKTEVSSK